MRCIVEYTEFVQPPRLTIFVHGAPHRRVHLSVIEQYRRCLRAACFKAGVFTPIAVPVDLTVHFIDPSSPDLDNLIGALFQALDGATLERPGILADDSLVQSVRMSKLFPTQRERTERPLQLPKFAPLEAVA